MGENRKLEGASAMIQAMYDRGLDQGAGEGDAEKPS